VLAALAAGVPLLLLPLGAPSQLRMSRACTERGVAQMLEPDDRDRAQIAAALGRLRADEAYTVNARQLMTEIAELPGPEKAVRWLECLVGDELRS
jgi:UDP:flavonoid glycosyltransferase YjiC (YdhE family)